MQLKRKRHIAQALGAMTAQLLAATAAHAAGDPGTEQSSDTSFLDNQSDNGTVKWDSTVLFYKEDNSRVQAIEPVMSLDITDMEGDVVHVQATYDSLTGATPNGAVPWNATQTFVTPSKVTTSTTTTVTGASGGSQLVVDPVTSLVTRQYTADPNTLPVDSGFRDHRFALEGSYTYVWNPQTKLSGGAYVSKERDYWSVGLNGGIIKDFNHHNTTLSLTGNVEFATSNPAFGTPTPFATMDGTLKGPSQGKGTYTGLIGLTQAMNRHWLLQLTYSATLVKGYQTDPYRILSVVDPTTGAPQSYVYEGRPRHRFRQSLTLANKFAFGPTTTSLSGRYYHDSWGISAIDGEVSERIDFSKSFYIEPGFRYYHQTAANFFTNYLLAGSAFPDYASSDSRLGRFNATTFDLLVGYKFAKDAEFYVEGDRYKQTGQHYYADAPGALANQDLFSGVSATSVMAGLRFTMR